MIEFDLFEGRVGVVGEEFSKVGKISQKFQKLSFVVTFFLISEFLVK